MASVSSWSTLNCQIFVLPFFCHAFFGPRKGVLAKAIAMNSHPRKLLATDLPHRVEELQNVLHGVAAAVSRYLKFSMELKGVPGMLKGNRGEVVCLFFLVKLEAIFYMHNDRS